MADKQQPDQDLPPREGEFDLRRGLKILLIVGGIVIVISMICIGIWPSNP